MPRTPAQVAEKWMRNYGGSAESFAEGIRAITENPMEKAANAADKYLAGIQAALASQKWQNALRAQNFQEWKEKTIRLGRLRMADGAREGQGKVAKFMEQWIPYQQQLKQKLATMPSTSHADRRARLLAAFDHNSEFVYRK